MPLFLRFGHPLGDGFQRNVSYLLFHWEFVDERAHFLECAATKRWNVELILKPWLTQLCTEVWTEEKKTVILGQLQHTKGLKGQERKQAMRPKETLQMTGATPGYRPRNSGVLSPILFVQLFAV